MCDIYHNNDHSLAGIENGLDSQVYSKQKVSAQFNIFYEYIKIIAEL